MTPEAEKIATKATEDVSKEASGNTPTSPPKQKTGGNEVFLVLGAVLIFVFIILVAVGMQGPKGSAVWNEHVSSGGSRTTELDSGKYEVWYPSAGSFDSGPGKVVIKDGQGQTIFSKDSRNQNTKTTYSMNDKEYVKLGNFDVDSKGTHRIEVQGNGGEIYITDETNLFVNGACAMFVSILGFVAIVAYMVLQEDERKKALRALAVTMGLEFHEDDPFDIPGTYHPLNVLRKGISGQRASNVLSGTYRGQKVFAFDFRYTSVEYQPPATVKTKTYHLWAVMVKLGRNFPELFLRPENLGDKLIQELVGFEDIDLDNLEFSNLYVVKSRSKRFAYDIFHPRTMEHILKLPRDQRFEIEKDAMIMSFTGMMPPDKVKDRLDTMLDIWEKTPDYVLADDYFYGRAEDGVDGSTSVGQEAEAGPVETDDKEDEPNGIVIVKSGD